MKTGERESDPKWECRIMDHGLCWGQSSSPLGKIKIDYGVILQILSSTTVGQLLHATGTGGSCKVHQRGLG